MKAIQLIPNDDLILIDDDLTVDNIKKAIAYRFSLSSKCINDIRLKFEPDGTKYWKILGHYDFANWTIFKTHQVIALPNALKTIESSNREYNCFTNNNTMVNELEPIIVKPSLVSENPVALLESTNTSIYESEYINNIIQQSEINK